MSWLKLLSRWEVASKREFTIFCRWRDFWFENAMLEGEDFVLTLARVCPEIDVF